MRLPRLPNRIGAGILLGFSIPLAWVFANSGPANSIDTSSRSTELNQTSAEDLLAKERALMAELGWKDRSAEPRARLRASELLEDDLFREEQRATERKKSLKANANLIQRNVAAERANQEEQEEIEKLSKEHDAMLAALLAEYQELERSAEFLTEIDKIPVEESLAIGGEKEPSSEGEEMPAEVAAPPQDSKGTQATGSRKETSGPKQEGGSTASNVQQPQKAKPASAEAQLQKQGYVVVGKGKQWVEKAKPGEQGRKQRREQLSMYSPYFGRIELTR